MFRKIKRLLNDVEYLQRQTSELKEYNSLVEKRIESLEHPAKYKIGEDLKYYIPNHCGDPLSPIKVKVLSTYYDYTRMYSVFDGSEILYVTESSLWKD